MVHDVRLAVLLVWRARPPPCYTHNSHHPSRSPLNWPCMSPSTLHARPSIVTRTHLGIVAGDGARVQFHVASERVDRSTPPLFHMVIFDHPHMMPCQPTMRRRDLHRSNVQYGPCTALIALEKILFPQVALHRPQLPTLQKNIEGDRDVVLRVVTLPS